MPKPHDRFHALEGEFDLPSRTIQFQDLEPRTCGWQTGPDEEKVRRLQRLLRYLCLLLARLLSQSFLGVFGCELTSPNNHQSSWNPFTLILDPSRVFRVFIGLQSPGYSHHVQALLCLVE